MLSDINAGCLVLAGIGLLLALLLGWLMAFIQANWLLLLILAGFGWGVRTARRRAAAQRSRQQFLQDTFYRLVQDQHGRLTVFEFAVQAQLPGAEARDYLNARAKEFYADFEPSDRGDILYVFPVSSAVNEAAADADSAS